MMKRIVTKTGTLYVADSALQGEYTADKLSILNEFTKQKPLAKATTDELIELCDKVLGKTVKPSQCKQCSRNKWVTLLKSYQEVATKILEIKDKEKIEAFEAEQTDTETTETKEEKKKPTDKKKGSKK